MKNNLVNQDIKTDKPVPMSYEALKSERDALERQLSMSEAKCKGYFSDAAAALVRGDALAVENAALKDAIPRLKNIDYSNDSMDDVSLAEDIGFNTAVTQINNMVIETPATSAAVAAIEARGVEKALAVVSACRENICPGGLSENRQYEESIVQPHLDGIADELENLIIELREAK